MQPARWLVVTADDFGIGPATSQGILDLAARGRVTGTVLLVNTPYAENAVRMWRRSGATLELGWHPCLTLDRPVLPAGRVTSLVRADGSFHTLGCFLRRLMVGKIRASEVHAEFTAQYERFRDLVGGPPTLVNTHHHVQVFWPIGEILRSILRRQRTLPYLRCVREPWRVLAAVPGARLKRLLLSTLGRPGGRRQRAEGFAGNDWLAGITDPPAVHDPRFFVRWLSRVPGRVVELTCHPGHLDETLIGRDCNATDGQLQRRVAEYGLLLDETFPQACAQFGLVVAAPRDLPATRHGAQAA